MALLMVVGLLIVATLPFAVASYGKHRIRTVLGSRFDFGPGQWRLDYDAAVLGGDSMYPDRWGIRYKLNHGRTAGGFDIYFFFWPHFASVDAPIFHS